MAIDLLEGLGEALLGRARHAAERPLEVLDRGGEVVVLGSQKAETLVELAVLLVGDEVDGTDCLQAAVQLDHPLADGHQVARGIV
jgi:hypothetical protein